MESQRLGHNWMTFTNPRGDHAQWQGPVHASRWGLLRGICTLASVEPLHSADVHPPTHSDQVPQGAQEDSGEASSSRGEDTLWNLTPQSRTTTSPIFSCSLSYNHGPLRMGSASRWTPTLASPPAGMCVWGGGVWCGEAPAEGLETDHVKRESSWWVEKRGW